MNIFDIDENDLLHYLKPRVLEAHKGDYGHSLLIGGDVGYVGAIILAAMASARCGSGLTSIATRANHATQIAVSYPELMAHGVHHKHQLKALFNKATVIGIGPGLGQSIWSATCFKAVLNCDLPLIVDADALNLLAEISLTRDNWILTPHPGEAARLLDCTLETVQADRYAAVKLLQQRYGGIAILKGHHTLIATKHSVYRCLTGNPGMASGGMGDLLTGVITGLVAQKIPLTIAAQLGVYLHGKAGDLAAKQGQRGLLASDLWSLLHGLVNPNV
jgi:NAD(P)H-hydrate epimerase